MSTTLAPPREPSGAPTEAGSRRLTDRVFRAKVRETAATPDEPTTKLVPKPRQS